MNVATWLEKEFYYSNHRKYHKYFKEWFDNLLDVQIVYFEKQMQSQINGSMIQH